MAAGAWWIPLHVLLVVGYVALAWALWPANRIARVLMALFVVANTAFLTLDGVLVGYLTTVDPGQADTLWGSPGVRVLADVTGATWCAALLAISGAYATVSKPLMVGLAITWLAFVATGVSWIVAVGVAGVLTYLTGTAGLAAALLIIASVQRQHVGPEALVGMLLVAVAGAIDVARGRSTPAASSPPSPD
jgi:hypothetical protein